MRNMSLWLPRDAALTSECSPSSHIAAPKTALGSVGMVLGRCPEEPCGAARTHGYRNGPRALTLTAPGAYQPLGEASPLSSPYCVSSRQEYLSASTLTRLVHAPGVSICCPPGRARVQTGMVRGRDWRNYPWLASRAPIPSCMHQTERRAGSCPAASHFPRVLRWPALPAQAASTCGTRPSMRALCASRGTVSYLHGSGGDYHMFTLHSSFEPCRPA